MYVCNIYIYIYVHLQVCVNIYIYIRIYTHIHMYSEMCSLGMIADALGKAMAVMALGRTHPAQMARPMTKFQDMCVCV